jgi:Domain of unknown function (DUF5753)
MPQEGTDVMANDRDARGDLGMWLGEELRCARLAAGYTSQDQSVLHRRIGAPEVMAMQLEHLLTILPAGDPAALEQAFVGLTAIIGLLTAGYAASLRRAVRRPASGM